MLLFKEQRIILILTGMLITQGLSATNTLNIGTYSVQPNTNFVVQLEAINTDPFVAFQADIHIPEGFSYVDGSAQLNASRISGHSLTASLQAGNVLRLIGYSENNTSFIGNSGTLVSFSLKSGTVPGDFYLAITNGILGDYQTKNTITGFTNGNVTVLCSNIQYSVDDLDFGRVALGTFAQQSLLINNIGNRDLVVTELTFNDPQFSIIDPSTFTVLPGANKSITVRFTPLKKQSFSNQILIKSNDPDQPETRITLKAVAFAVNELHTGNIIGASSSIRKLEFTINNMEPFTGFQFDLILPKPMTYLSGTAQLFRLQDHVVAVSQINQETLRVASYSPTNKNYNGIDGKMLSIDFSFNGVSGWYPINIINVIISDASGENILSASLDGSLQITSPDIDTESQLNFGNVSILSKGNQNEQIYNRGQEVLTISQLLFSSDFFSSTQNLPVSVSPNSFIEIPIEFKKSVKGSVTGTLKILSNDPDENPFTVNLSANAYAPNYLQLSQQNIRLQETKLIPVEITNEETFVAFQFDLKYPEGLTPDLRGILLTDRKTDHVVEAILQANNVLRIVAYSPSQDLFSGKAGAIVSIPFKAEATILPGTYNLELSNSFISSSLSENILYSMQNGTIIVQKQNQLAANAGVDQSANEGATVSLDGSASSDPNGNLLTYKWTGPAGITLSSLTTAKPTFTAPEVTTNTDFTFSLVVNDGTIDSPVDQVVITVKNVNKSPIANAGVDQSANEGSTISLDGSLSTDPDGNTLIYKWIAPIGIIMSSTNVAKPTFTAPEVNANTDYTFLLVVNDGTIDSPVDQVVITVKNVNKYPVANAGVDQSENEGSTISLNGSLSTDPDGNTLIYKWTAPIGIIMSSTNVAKPTFTAPEVNANTDYTFLLVVNDGTIDSPVDQVVITIKNVNKSPVANAGVDQSANEGSTISLNGSLSTDPDGNTLIYKWTAPIGITMSPTNIDKPTFTAPEVKTNTDFTFSLVVNDGSIDSPVDQVVITIFNVNKSPVANAGVDQSANEGSTISLNGSLSTDPDGNTLIYKWTAPIGITMSPTNIDKPTFTAPEVKTNTDFTFSLVVNDGSIDSPVDQVVITIKNVNKSPVANAGVDQSANEGSTISLNGSLSTDPDGNTLIYKWTAPIGIIMSSTNVAKPTFTAPEVNANTDYTFLLVVNDGTIDSPVDQVVITIKNVNKSPVANAGVDQSANEGSTISLNGSLSTDPDGNTLIYKWTAPTGIILSSTTSAKPTFTAPEVTINSNYTFSLVVNDGTVDSQIDQVVITVKNVNKSPFANAGVEQIVNEGTSVTLNGSESSDPDGNPLTFMWTSPSGINLSSTIVAKPTFIAPEVKQDSVLNFSLIVNDGLVNSQTSSVKISVKNVIKTGLQNTSKSDFIIYPNPFNNELIIEDIGNMNKIDFEIFDSSLRQVYKGIFREKVVVQTTSFTPGIYLIKLKSGENFEYVKMVKN